MSASRSHVHARLEFRAPRIDELREADRDLLAVSCSWRTFRRRCRPGTGKLISTPGDWDFDHLNMTGAQLILHGLEAIELSGAVGEVVSWFDFTGRLGISLREGGRKTIRPCSVMLLDKVVFDSALHSRTLSPWTRSMPSPSGSGGRLGTQRDCDSS